MNEMMLDTRPILGTYFRDPVGEEENWPQIALASDEDRAIDLSCRACGALALGAGLGFPVGGPPLRSVLHPQPPIQHMRRQCCRSIRCIINLAEVPISVSGNPCEELRAFNVVDLDFLSSIQKHVSTLKRGR